MFLIVGLGNPGEKYKNTRHNIGFAAIDKIAINFNFPELKLEKNFLSLFSKEKINKKEVILAKPQTFMNLSGRSILKIARFYKINLENIIVIHDDVDLPEEKIRIVKNRGSGGHKGINSIIFELKTKNFIRFRVGIKPNQETKEKTEKQLEKFVLKKLTKEEKEVTEKTAQKTLEAIDFFLKNDFKKTQNKYN